MRKLEFQPQFAEALRRCNMPVIITGATGWLGQAALEMFHSALGDQFPARVTAFAARPRRITLRGGGNIDVHSLPDIASFDLPGALVFHLAFLTREHASAQPIDAYIAANRQISADIRAFLKRCGASGIFIPSSGAARFGTLEDNPYGELKREDEEEFAALAADLAIPAAFIRVFNLAGPFINKRDSYALACILSDISQGGPVALRAAHPVWRGFAHVQDVLNIALGCLQNGLSPPVFDTCGEPIEIGDLAARAATLLTGRLIPIQRPEWEAGPADRYLGDAAAFNALAAQLQIPLHGLDAQIRDTATYLATA